MNREIKFRAWDIENKCMESWEEIQEMWEDFGYSRGIFNNDHWVCMQYTGLKDKNGKEIYEGDKMIQNDHWIVEVVWLNEGWAMKVLNHKKETYHMSWGNTGYKIIGTIHDKE